MAVSRDIELNLTGKSRLQATHDDGVTPDWYIPLVGSSFHGHIDAAATAAAAFNRAARGPVVIVENDSLPQGRTYIFLDRIKATGSFSGWTAGGDLSHVNDFVDILENLV